jgi:hypothetical protein
MWSRRRTVVVVASVAAILAGLPAGMRAQSFNASPVANAGGPRAETARAGAPRAEAPRLPMVTQEQNASSEPVYQQAGGQRKGTTLMIVGFAALLVGAIIGDDAGTIVMLGGAGIGLYGLYLFLQ